MALTADEAEDESELEFADRRRQIFEGTIRRLLQPVAEALDDPDISEIMINGHREIYVDRRVRERLASGEDRVFSRTERLDSSFASAEHLEAAARAIAQYSGKLLAPDELSLEARLYDKSRVHIVQPPAARNGLCIAIRRFAKANHSIDHLVATGTMTREIGDFLNVCLHLKKNLVVSGGTSTGKTTILNALSEFMDTDERIVVIEDVNELELKPPHTLYFEAQKHDRFGRGGITIRNLFKAALRMRPDRILVGECRGEEALDMIQAMTSGHSGSMTTLHADTAIDALGRLETMALMGDIALPQRALRGQIASAIDVIVQLQRIGGRRGIVQVTEVAGLTADGNYELNDVFELREDVYTSGPEGVFSQPTGRKVAFAKEAKAVARGLGVSFPG